MSSERKEKKKQFSSALSDFRKYQKKLSGICGKFESIEEWNGYAQEAIDLIDKYSLLPKNITSPVLKILNVSRKSLDKINTVCDTLDGNLDHLTKWIEKETTNLSNTDIDEPLRAQQSRSQSSRGRDYGTDNMSRGSGSTTKFVVVGIIIAIIISGGFFYLYGDKIIFTPQTPQLVLKELSPYNGEKVSGARTVDLSVRVMDQNLNPVSGVTVTFYKDDEFFQNVSTNSNGYATAKNWAITSGDHSWAAFAYKSGYKNSLTSESTFLK